MLERGTRAKLRAAVRKEQNDRWQFWELRIKVLGMLLTAATGAIGAFIGLIAIRSVLGTSLRVFHGIGTIVTRE